MKGTLTLGRRSNKEQPAVLPEGTPPLSAAYALAAKTVAGVLQGKNLNESLERAVSKNLTSRAAAQELAYATLRGWGSVDVILDGLLSNPLRDVEIRGLLLIALMELRRATRAPYTVVDQAVECASVLDHAKARGLINAVLRAYLRDAPAIEARLAPLESARYGHPQWWIDQLRVVYPDHWQSILDVANIHPPMTLRVNRRRGDVATYLRMLETEGLSARALGHEAVILAEPVRVERLPGFETGLVSVQDAGAQYAARLLDVRPAMQVLDACAAPGGKTGHILELADCELMAMDISSDRLQRVTQNLTRLGLRADMRVGDSLFPERHLPPGIQFDRILLDAPCSATGVVRRHPDIRWLRRKNDFAGFARTQARMLAGLWPLLRPGGKLLYTTCSIFPMENQSVIETFLARTPQASREDTPDIPGGMLLPGAHNDGFFHALIQKRP
jgi:16S rRNA (cytosine967-C5)-methyltransferase